MKKVMILFGGNSSEHYVSCKSAKSIALHIDKRMFSYQLVGISFCGDWYKFNDDLSLLSNGEWLTGNVLKIDNVIEYLKGFDVVFPITHGNNGEDGKLQALFELFDIKYVGCSSYSSMLGFDKSLSKLLFNNLEIPQVPYLVVGQKYNISNIISEIGYPMIVKPCCGGSSIGINKANNKKELVKALKCGFKYDDRVVVEKFINCRELECAVLGNRNYICSVPGEIKSCNDFYDYDAKYVQNSETFIPEDLPNNVIEIIREYVDRICFGFEIKDYCRMDFFYDEYSDRIYINEINTIPGFTEISMFPKLMEHENISYSDLISILINNC